jgi:hypothetical protein
MHPFTERHAVIKAAVRFQLLFEIYRQLGFTPLHLRNKGMLA